VSRIRWVAQIACEYGGPAIIADVKDYASWLGASPYPLEARRVLHYWGQFTDELPAAFAQEGGHAYRPSDTLEALHRDREALLAAVRGKWSDAAITVDDETGEAHVLLSDDRQMWIEYGPKSPYEEACDGDAPLWEHTFQSPSGREGTGLFWDKEGPGDFVVGVSEARDELVLLRTWVDEEALENTAQAFVDASPESEIVDEDIELRVGSGRVVVGYSPHTWLHMLPSARLMALANEAEAHGLSKEETRARFMSEYESLFDERDVVRLDAGDDTGIAAAIAVRPGVYRIAVGRHEPDDEAWSCIWCRFTLVH
jgi:hypothetical protein